LWIHRIERGRISEFSALNTFAKELEIDLHCTRQIFLERLTNLSEMDRYIPSHIYIKNMRSPIEVPELQVHCEVVCITEPLIEQQCQQLWSV